MGLLNVISYSGVPATAVGNNMIIRKDAYWQTGGYSKIKFSITEDYKLYSEVCSKGWLWNNIMNQDVLAFSEKTQGFGNLSTPKKTLACRGAKNSPGTGGFSIRDLRWLLLSSFPLGRFIFWIMWQASIHAISPFCRRCFGAIKFTLQSTANT